MAFMLILLTVAIYGIIHSLLASLDTKQRVQSLIGPRTGQAYRLVYNLLAALTLLPVLALPMLLPDTRLYTIPMPWTLLTLALQALAGLALAAGVLQTGVWAFLGIQQLTQPGKDAPPRLIVSGLYRWVRHPLYTAGLVLIWLLPAMTVNWLAFNLGMTAYIVIGARFEERKLLREFGATYEEYRRRTPMLIPWKIPPRQ